jgi:hypothetical protein
MLLENVGIMFGGFLPVTLALIGALSVLIFRAAARGRRGARQNHPARDARIPGGTARALLYTGLAVLAHVVMFALMITRHPYVYYWIDHRYWYYPLPLLGIVLFGAVASLDALLPRLTPPERRALQALLVLVIISNAASFRHYQALMVNGPWFGPVHAQSERLKGVLRTGVDDPLLAANYRAFGVEARDGRTIAP